MLKDRAIAFHELKWYQKAWLWLKHSDFMRDHILINPKPRILVLGHGGHGKDTLCEKLVDDYGFEYVDKTKFFIDCLIKNWDKISVGPYHFRNACVDDVYKKRRSNRKLLFDSICELNELFLATKVMAQFSGMITGIRSIKEYEQTKHLFDLILYVDASDRVPLEPTMEIPYNPYTMHRIDNNGYAMNIDDAVWIKEYALQKRQKSF